MRMTIEATGDQATARIGRLLRFKLSRFAGDIADVRLSAQTIEGPCGTPLTRCRARIDLHHGGDFTVEEIQSNLDLAVGRALDRSLRAIQRRLARERGLTPS